MVEERVERKLSAILSADVVGYSRLVEADEAATLAGFKAHLAELIEPAIADNRGRIVKTLGDGVLAEFASAVDAVLCARAIQAGMAGRNAGVAEDRRLRFRIGVNVGDVVIDGDDIQGDGVNVAARLESLAEPGGICISGTVYDHVQGKIAAGFADLGEREVKNLARPIRVYRVVDGDAAAPTAGARQGLARRRLGIAAAAAGLLAAVASLAWWQPWAPSGTPPSAAPPSAATAPYAADQPSVAVLPFANMSAEPAQEFFSDGITEDIITDLSKLSGLFVVARNSSFAYKGRATDVRTIARELGVTHVLEGSVRKSGRRVRITAQLIDARTGNHQWAERYDREITDVFKVQDEVTRRIVSVLAVKLTSADRERMTRTDQTSPEAYELLLRGLALQRRFTPETVARAREFFLKAIEQDPGYARAYANVGYTYALDTFFGVSDAPDETLARGLKYAKQALALNARIPQTHFALAFIYWQQRRAEEALRAASDILRVAPNFTDGMVLLASVQSYSGRYREAFDTITTAIRRNPGYSFFYLALLGRVNLALGQYQAAVDAYRQVLERNPAFIIGRRELAASLALLGRIDDARWEAQEILTLQPKFTLRRERERVMFHVRADMDRYINGLRLAGLPE